TASENETKQLAFKLASLVQKADVITLEGDLGAGKTTFTQGFAKGLNIEAVVSSPTFTIIKEYDEGRLPLYHMDVYRLEFSDEDIGFYEYFHGDGVSIVEWAQFIDDYLPEERLNIRIKYGDNNSRHFTFEATGYYYDEKITKLFE